MVHSVHVVNRKDLGGERLARVQITVDGELCGSLPSITETDVDYTVTCQTPVYGTEIRLTQINDTYLHFQGINVYCHPEYTVDLYEQISVLEASESSLQSQLSGCESEVSRLEGLLDAEYASNAELTAERDALLLQIDGLNDQISTL